jgi:hypothetical protein
MDKKRIQYLKEYHQKNRKDISLHLLHSTDGDIIEVLEKQDSKQGYIKDAIRHYMQYQENKQK